MKLIPLSATYKCKNSDLKLFAMIDDEDYELVNKYNWQLRKWKHGFYANRMFVEDGKVKCMLMHRLIMNPSNNQIIDHDDHNGLNNQKANLRIATYTQNNSNRSKIPNCSSKYKGVCVVYYKRPNKTYMYWAASIKKDKKMTRIGHYKTEIEAAIAYNEKAKEFFGEFAHINIINP